MMPALIKAGLNHAEQRLSEMAEAVGIREGGGEEIAEAGLPD